MGDIAFVDTCLSCKDIVIIIIVYYATKAANIHSYTYKNTIKNKIKFKKNIKILNIGLQNALMHRQVQVIRS